MSDPSRYGYGGKRTVDEVPVHYAEDPKPTPLAPDAHTPSGESFGYPAGYPSGPGAPLYEKRPAPEPMTPVCGGKEGETNE